MIDDFEEFEGKWERGKLAGVEKGEGNVLDGEKDAGDSAIDGKKGEEGEKRGEVIARGGPLLIYMDLGCIHDSFLQVAALSTLFPSSLTLHAYADPQTSLSSSYSSFSHFIVKDEVSSGKTALPSNADVKMVMDISRRFFASQKERVRREDQKGGSDEEEMKRIVIVSQDKMLSTFVHHLRNEGHSASFVSSWEELSLLLSPFMRLMKNVERIPGILTVPKRRLECQNE